MIACYFLLPEGVLRAKHPLTSQLELSTNLLTSTLQIFGWNLMPMTIIAAGNLIAIRSKLSGERYVPVGYAELCLITLSMAVVAGTWSFEVVSVAPPLGERLLSLFDLSRHCALLEVSAYVLAAATSFKLTLLFTGGPKPYPEKKWRDITLTRSEKVLIVLAFVLLLSAALIESNRIIELSKATSGP
jgi:hypothetical protein